MNLIKLLKYHVTARAGPGYRNGHGRIILNEAGIGSILYSLPCRTLMKTHAAAELRRHNEVRKLSLFPNGEYYYANGSGIETCTEERYESLSQQ